MEYIEINKIYDNHRVMHFTTPVCGAVEHRDDMVMVSIPEANIYVIGENINSCIHKVYDDLFFVWDNYAMEEDAAMTGDAVEMKKWLLSTAEVENA